MPRLRGQILLTPSTAGEPETAAAVFAGAGNGQSPVGDSGFEHGGDIPGHAGREVGMDIDVWPARTDSARCTAGRITWQSSTYDRAATRSLVQEIRAKAPGHVALVFFNDPQLISEGLTTSCPNHDNHLHIRYQQRPSGRRAAGVACGRRPAATLNESPVSYPRRRGPALR